MAWMINLRGMFRQTSQMNCWFYAAKTVVYHRTGRLLLETDYMRISPSHPGRSPFAEWLQVGLPPRLQPVQEFASAFGFRELPYRPATWDASNLEKALRTFGPLWFAGKDGSFRHVVVVTGINNASNVWCYDPAVGTLTDFTLANFNLWKTHTVQGPGGRVHIIPNPLYALPSHQRLS
jgi:hypothetical protein